MAVLTASEAEQVVNHYNGLNQKKLPPTLAIIQRFMKENVLHVCNVGPWVHYLERPSIRVFVPKYDPAADKEKTGYSKSTPFPVIHRFSKLQSEDEMSWCEDDGRTVLLDLIGVGWGLKASESLLQFGVFVPMEKGPTSAELDKARAKLDDYTDYLIREAREAYDLGLKEWSHVRSERHLWAGRIRGIQEKWVSEKHTDHAVLCQMCGRSNPTGVAKCACGSILDVALFRKLQAQQDAMMEEATRPAKK